MPGRTVLIVNTDELFAVTLRMALREFGFEAHRPESSGSASVMAQVGALPAGVLLLDPRPAREPRGTGVDPGVLIREVRRLGWQAIALIDRGNVDREAALVAAGAAGTIAMTSSLTDLVAALQTVSAGGPVMPDARREELLALHRRQVELRRQMQLRFDRLSRREREVLALMCEGQRAAQIAERFVVSMTTVRTQIRAIRAKLDCTGQLEATALAHKFARLPHS
jgi:DNA-binding NarL/FixJ family response regulator